jgi:two-component system cell cycle response regulator
VDQAIRLTVLVLDAAAEEIGAARIELQAGGHAVVTAAASHGLDQVAATEVSDRPDVIVFGDLAGPHRWDRLSEVLADPGCLGVPVVLLADRRDPAGPVEGLRRGAHDLLRTPFEPVELLARVQAAGAVGRLAREVQARDDELAGLRQIDQLTGLPNRRNIEDYLISATSLARRNIAPMAVLIVDIDHLRSVNDRYGHLAGDAVLTQVAGRLSASMRAEDMIGRWGNEVFLAVLPMTGVEGAVKLAERLRLAAADPSCQLPDGTLLPVTISVGCAASMLDGAETLVRAADEARCRAKECGRNRAVVSNSAGYFMSVGGGSAADPSA